MITLDVDCPDCGRPAGQRCEAAISGRSVRGSPHDSVIFCRARVQAAYRITGRETSDRLARDRAKYSVHVDADAADADADCAVASDPCPGLSRSADDSTHGPARLARVGPCVRVKLDFVVDVRHGDGSVRIPGRDPHVVICEVSRRLVPVGVRTRPGWRLRAGLTRASFWQTRSIARRLARDRQDVLREIRIRLEFVADLRRDADALPSVVDVDRAIHDVARAVVPDFVRLHPGWRLAIGFTADSSHALRVNRAPGPLRQVVLRAADGDRPTSPSPSFAPVRVRDPLGPRPMSHEEITDLIARAKKAMRAGR